MTTTPPTERQTLNRVERFIADSLPPGWLLGERRGRSATRRGLDAEWEIRSPDGRAAVFVVKVRRTLGGRRLDDVLAHLNDADTPPLIVAPFLSATLRATLASRGISYADTTGNIRLVADEPGLFVERKGASKDPWPASDVLQSLRGRGAGRALRALVDFRPPFGVRDLSERASVPLGSLSRTLDLLDREGLVTRNKQGQVAALDWERALRRWAQDYEFARSNRVSFYLDPRGTTAVTRKLTEASMAYALTGAAAAQAFAPIAPARQVALYIDDVDRAAERLGLRPADSGANVVLAEPFDMVAFDRLTERDGLTIVAASQLAADLLTGTGREPAEGNELLDWMRNNEDAWRA